MNNFCSPNNNNIVSCFNKTQIKNIASIYNKKYPKNKITVPDTLNTKNLESFWKNLRNNINKQINCDNEQCWLEKNFLDDSYNNLFLPKYPSTWKDNKTAWLSTVDINNVLEQYEKNSNYKYIGAVPIDFDKKISIGFCIVNELCNLNIKKLYLSGIRYIGAVFNLDPHDKPGSHWVSLFVNLINGGIYFFDSYGHKPPEQIAVLMERIRKMGNDLVKKNVINLYSEHSKKIKFKIISDYEIKIDKNIILDNDLPVIIDNNSYNIDSVIEISDGHVLRFKNKLSLSKKIKDFLEQDQFTKFYNNIRFQYLNSECGVYSIYFQIEMLKGKSFETIIENIVDDNLINKQREVYYRN